MKPKRIPLFPLELVLFPSMVMPLHIFEPRYKEMTRRCLEKRLEFGVVLAKSEGIAAVGCTAEILKLVREYPDGRMDILTEGRSRYRVLAVFEERPYLEADVEYLIDGPGPAPPRAPDKLLKLYEQCHALVFGRAPGSFEPAGGGSLAFHISGILPLDLDIKQEILETETEAERQDYLVQRINTWLPQLAHLSQVRRKAGGNGRGLG